MEIESSSLWREVTAILQNGPNPVNFVWTCKIFANNKTYVPMKILSIDIVRNYEDKYADEMVIELEISGGTYATNIYPYKEDVEIILYRQALMEGSDSPDPSKPKQSERFRATLFDTGNPVIEGNSAHSSTTTAMDIANSFTVKFQLINKAIEQLRMIGTGNTFRNTTADVAIKTVLGTTVKIIEVEGVRAPKGVDMMDGSNTTVRDHIIVPQGVMLTSIPQYIHDKCGGVYPAGLGYFYQGDYWYVYTCYDTTRWTKAKNTLTVVNVPPNKLPGVERTYRKSGTALTVLATGKVKFSDDSEVRQLNHGNGVRFASADKLMGEVVTVKNNIATMSRGANNTEVITTMRKTGLNLVKQSSAQITSNAFLEYSALARRDGSIFELLWENSDSTLIMPGMAAKVLYLDNGVVKSLYGVVLGAHHYVKMKGKGMTDGRHIMNTGISIFVKRVQTS